MDNMRDMCAKGRQAKGERHYRAKLTAVQVIEIRTRDEPCKKLALEYGISGRHIADIIAKKIWRHV
jgi:hypothetical protein